MKRFGIIILALAVLCSCLVGCTTGGNIDKGNDGNIGTNDGNKDDAGSNGNGNNNANNNGSGNNDPGDDLKDAGDDIGNAVDDIVDPDQSTAVPKNGAVTTQPITP